MKKAGLFIIFFMLLFSIDGASAKVKPCKTCYCSVAANTVYFGAYNALTKPVVDSAGNVEVICGTSVIGDVMSYAIELSGSKKGLSPREMSGPKKYILTYNLYTAPSRTIIWGDGKGSTSTVADSFTFITPCCVTKNYTIYGRLDGGQNVAPGLYSDTVIVSVNF